MPTLSDIANLLGCPPPPDGARPITGIATLADANPDELSFVTSDAFAEQFAATRAAGVIMPRKLRLTPPADKVVLVVDDADLAVAKVLELFAPPVPRPPAGVDPAARGARSASLAPHPAVGPHVFVGERARVGARTVLHPGVYLGDDVTVGDDCVLFPGVVVRERITLGSRVIIHAGSVLGSDGFGYRWDGSKHAKVPQIGTE